METFCQDSMFRIEENAGKASLINQHFHTLYEIYYLKAGESVSLIEDALYTFKKGDIVIIPPNTLHKTIRSDAARKRVLLYLDHRFLNEFQNENLQLWDSVSVLHVDAHERIHHIFDELLHEYKTKQDLYFLKALTYELIVLLKRKNERTDISLDNSSCSKRISEVLNYLNTMYQTDATLTSTAMHFFISPTYLSKLFSEHTGMTFSNYLRKYRVKKSIELLTSTDKNITEIAFDVGFNSANHFCKTFKSIMNISPLQFRKNYLQSN